MPLRKQLSLNITFGSPIIHKTSIIRTCYSSKFASGYKLGLVFRKIEELANMPVSIVIQNLINNKLVI